MSKFLSMIRPRKTSSKKSECTGGLSDAVLNSYVVIPAEQQLKWEHLLTANVSKKEKVLRLKQLNEAKEKYNGSLNNPNNTVN